MKQNYLAILALLFYVIFARDISHAIFNEKQSLYSNLWLSPIRIHYRLPLCLHGYKIQSFEIDRTSLHSSLSLLAIARRDETSDFFSSTINHNHAFVERLPTGRELERKVEKNTSSYLCGGDCDCTSNDIYIQETSTILL